MLLHHFDIAADEHAFPRIELAPLSVSEDRQSCNGFIKVLWQFDPPTKADKTWPAMNLLDDSRPFLCSQAFVDIPKMGADSIGPDGIAARLADSNLVI